MKTKRYVRLITDEQLSTDQVMELYDCVQAHAATQLMTVYDSDGDTVSGSVSEYDAGDDWIYEIPLQQHVDTSQGQDIAQELVQVFDFDFEFEITTE